MLILKIIEKKRKSFVNYIKFLYVVPEHHKCKTRIIYLLIEKREIIHL